MKKKRPNQNFGVELSADDMREALNRFLAEYPSIAEEIRKKNESKNPEPPNIATS